MKITDIHPDVLYEKVGETLVLEPWYNKKPFQIIGEIGSAIALPDTKNYRIKVCVNDWEWVSDKPIEKKENYCRYSQRFVVDKVEMPYQSNENIGKVFVYLMDGDDPICYWKGGVLEFLNPSPEFRWLPFTNDLCVNEVTEQHMAGMFQMKLAINNPTVNGVVDWRQLPAWKKPPPKRLNSYKMRAFIFQCKDIPSADEDGSSDPYIQIWTPEKEKV